ncbi:MAG TPA: hypothetical protein VNX47_01305 [Nevskia sp.]|nr:hypothetical protein [Nevskia sp.]
MAAPAWGDAAPPAAPSDARTSIDRAIEHEQSRRSGAIAGMVIGGLFIVGGSVDSAVASAQNHDDRNNGRPASHNPYVGYAIGLGVGLPIMGISGWLFADSQHKLNTLRRERLSVSYSPDTHQPVLQLSFSY